MPRQVKGDGALKLLMTADAVGGVWQYAVDLAGGLVPHGVETTLAVLGPPPSPAQAAEARRVKGLRLVETGLPLDWTAAAPAEVERAGAGIASLALEAGADIVHLNSPALAAEGAFTAPVISACHSCVATWWRAVRGGPLPEDFAWRTELVRRGYATSKVLVAPTKAFAEATAGCYGLEAAPEVVHNGRAAASGARRAEGAPDGPFVFTAGRLWDDGKNLGVLDAAAAGLFAPVLAAGPLEGPNGARIGLDHARALGSLTSPEVASYLAARPVFCSVALYEPFGLAVLEAAQAGCPLVLSDIPTFRELWDGAALFVDPSDPEALARALDRLLRDPVDAATLGAEARRRARRYTAEAMAKGIFRLYRSLVRSGPAPKRAGAKATAATRPGARRTEAP